jgi:nucleotide-binding universal stress UspA family protein
VRNARGAPAVDAGAPARVLLATEGRPIPAAAVDVAARLAKENGGRVHVFSVARVWGTTFGMPNPGLLPTRKEWDEQRTLVEDAVQKLKRKGVEATGNVLATRKATKRIVREAERLGCAEIVMAADPPKNRLVADLMWSQEPYRVKRRADVPVHLVVED